MRLTKPEVTRLLRSLNLADWRCQRGVPAIFLVSRDNHYSINSLQFERDPGEEFELDGVVNGNMEFTGDKRFMTLTSSTVDGFRSAIELEVGTNSKPARAIIGVPGIALIAISLGSTDSRVIRPPEPPVTPPIEPPVNLIILARPRGLLVSSMRLAPLGFVASRLHEKSCKVLQRINFGEPRSR